MFVCVFVGLGQSPHRVHERVVQQLLVPFFSLLSWKLLLSLPNNEKMTPRANCLGWRGGGNGNKLKGAWYAALKLSWGVPAPHTPCFFPMHCGGRRDTGRIMQDSVVSGDAFLVS